MNNERRTSEAPRSGPEAALQATVNTTDGHDADTLRIGYRQRPYVEGILEKVHPTKVYFDTFVLRPVSGGYMPVLVSSVLIDTAIRH